MTWSYPKTTGAVFLYFHYALCSLTMTESVLKCMNAQWIRSDQLGYIYIVYFFFENMRLYQVDVFQPHRRLVVYSSRMGIFNPTATPTIQEPAKLKSSE